MLTISGASRRPWDPEERVPTSPFHRQRKWESDWTASLYSYTTQEGQELGTWFPDSWVSVPHGMLPSPKHYFCKRFSFNKGTRTSHVTFIHESQCVCISTLVVGSREGAGIAHTPISWWQEPAKPSGNAGRAEKRKRVWFVKPSHWSSKNMQVLCFKTSTGDALKHKQWLRPSFRNISLIP